VIPGALQHQIASGSSDLVDETAGFLGRRVNACLTMCSGFAAREEQWHWRCVVGYGLKRGLINTPLKKSQPQGKQSTAFVASSPAGTYTTDSAVSIGLMALEEPCGLIGSVSVIAAELGILLTGPDSRRYIASVRTALAGPLCRRAK
jgi:hypothetical protein